MDAERYQRFTEELTANLADRPEVLGLVAVGSMASGPDEFSDHDFFVVVAPEHAQAMRDDLGWLPDHDRVVLAFAETAHGVKVLYDDAHLLEFAVFAPEELTLSRVNRHRVLLDRSDVTSRLGEVVAATTRLVEQGAASDEYLLGQLLTGILVGVARHRRGEHLSALDHVHHAALRCLLELVERHVPAAHPERLDNLSPFRRVEQAYTALGDEIGRTFSDDLPSTARRLLDIAQRELEPRGDVFESAPWSVVRAAIS